MSFHLKPKNIIFLVLLSFGVTVGLKIRQDGIHVNSTQLERTSKNSFAKTWERAKNVLTRKLIFQSAKKSKIDQMTLPYDPETQMTAVQIISNRGYPIVSYSVMTEDGYILELHRIPHGKGQSPYAKPYGKPVFLQHGLLGSSVNWIVAPSNRSLAFRLADLGYDVWLGNARGNIYSRRHRTLNPRYQHKYWNFSWHEMGIYDIPAVLNFILSETGREKLIYIGHSMGSTMFFVTMSTFPELGSKIELMIAFAPAVSLAHMSAPALNIQARFVRELQVFYRLIGVRDFLSVDGLAGYWLRKFCKKNVFDSLLCLNVMFTLVGDNPADADPNLITLLENNTPAGISTRTVAHYALNHNAGEVFLLYDYGLLGNLVHYKQTKPPSYDLSKVNPPVYIFYGSTDRLTTPKDIAWLEKQLTNLKGSFQVESEFYNHLDFLFQANNNKLLYDRIISLLPLPST